MLTTVTGYPRIGAERELKFAEEKYFGGEISATELKSTAKKLRLENYRKMKEAGIDLIPCNDFSFYDGVLDAAFMLGAVPARYLIEGLAPLDRYFAAARGYQSGNADVKALPMKKWFNTNYHYIVPEIGDGDALVLSDDKPVELTREAVKAGVTPKTVVTGAYTFLKLAHYTGEKGAKDFAPQVAAAYSELLNKLSDAGAAWVQFDEPCLVTDMTDDDRELFNNLYCVILKNAPVKTLLQTYFGDVRDCYEDLCGLPFDSIGLDFVESKRSLEIVEKNGFPTDKILFAGVVNGKNVWRNDYNRTLDTLKRLSEHTENLAIGTSCSLLHVPYTLTGEKSLNENLKKKLSFAEEKLTELGDIKQLYISKNPETCEVFIKNQEIFKTGDKPDEKVRARVSALTDGDFIRKPDFYEREKLQKQALNLPLLPTTTIGSFPQTREVRSARYDFRHGRITAEEYEEFLKKKTAECIALQEQIGLDVLVHGEFERNDMVEYFGELLEGFAFTSAAWVQSYGTRCVKPPIISGDVSRKRAMTVKWITYAQSCTDKPVKGMLTGPVTILNWSFPREDLPLGEIAFQIALAIRDEVLDLEANGIKIIQVDEAALREKLPLRRADRYTEYLSWAIPAFRLVHSGVKPQTQIHTHMCYSEFGDIIREIDDMDADVITFEASRSDLVILDALKAADFKTECGPGVYDIHSPRVPSEQEIEGALGKMLEKLPADKLWVNPDCGLKTRGNEETVPSLKNLVAAAKSMRAKL